MKRIFVCLVAVVISLGCLGELAMADQVIGGINYDDAETGITSGTPDLANESTGNSSTVSGNFTDQFGFNHSYTATAMVSSGITSYGVTNGGPNHSDENRIEYQTGSDRFTFSSGWDSGDGSTGEFVTQMLTVNFNAIHDPTDFSVSVTSANTGGQSFETTAVQFIDGSGNLIGNLSYVGYWDQVGTSVNSDVITNSADVWTAEDTSVIDTATDSDNPIGGSNGSSDNATILASDFVSGGVSGYKITRFMEDVATVSGVAGTNTSTMAIFTTSNSAATLTAVVVPEPSSFAILMFGLCGFVSRRRR